MDDPETHRVIVAFGVACIEHARWHDARARGLSTAAAGTAPAQAIAASLTPSLYRSLVPLFEQAEARKNRNRRLGEMPATPRLAGMGSVRGAAGDPPRRGDDGSDVEGQGRGGTGAAAHMRAADVAKRLAEEAIEAAALRERLSEQLAALTTPAHCNAAHAAAQEGMHTGD